jgi:hypothetical protein
MLKFWRIFHIDNLSNASNLHIQGTLVGNPAGFWEQYEM